MSIFVLYHASCFDGTGAKLAANLKFRQNAKYIPVRYNEPFPPVVPLDGRAEVYILDFSYKREIMDEVQPRLKSLVVLDHHESAERELAGAEYATFDINKSGCVMAWEYFHPNAPIPELLLDIQDGDLWKFERPNTKFIRAALPTLNNNIREWEGGLHKEVYHNLVKDGKLLCTYQDSIVKSVVPNQVKVLPFYALRVGVCNTTTLTSAVGEAIYSSNELDVEFSMTYFIDQDFNAVLSFRSNNSVNVAVIAEYLGGGGHFHAAGAKVPVSFLEKLFAGDFREGLDISRYAPGYLSDVKHSNFWSEVIPNLPKPF